MRNDILAMCCAAMSLFSDGVAAQAALGSSPDLPVTHCKSASASGFYWLRPDAETPAFRVFCEMDTEFKSSRGGWTLVWSNLRGGVGKPHTKMHWSPAINSLPIYKGDVSGAQSTRMSILESFQVFIGLRHWLRVMQDSVNGRKEFLYAWAPDYGASEYLYATACSFRFNPENAWQVIVDRDGAAPLPNQFRCEVIRGAGISAIVAQIDSMRFSTHDRDNDTFGNNCAGMVAGPWWYRSCFDGSIVGGGEIEPHQRNGAYYKGSANDWGKPDGTGAGNGWLFVR